MRWTDRLDKKGEPPFVENFFIDPCQVGFEGKLYKGLVYIPDPETKPKQYTQRAPYIDVIAPHIPNIGYGSKVMFYYNPRAIMALTS